ncbi:MAG: serine/threonine-protein phosphatase [Oscillospiraceae bacterium]|nr:serine/threonine-protein phosphatase [Oscillospiraceae bacterium]
MLWRKRKGSLQVKLYFLIVAIILTITVGLLSIETYFFNRRVNREFNERIVTAVTAFRDTIIPDIVTHFRDAVGTPEYQEVRRCALAAGDESILADWMKQQRSWLLEDTMDPEPGFTLLDDYEMLVAEMQRISDYFKVDGVYLQVDIDGATYNIIDKDENLFYIGTVEPPIEEFEDYEDNAPIPPTIYRSEYGWLCTAIEPVSDYLTDEPVCLACVDIDMTTVMRDRFSLLLQSIALVAALTVAAIVVSSAILRRMVVVPLKSLSKAATGFAAEERNYTPEDVISLDIRANDEIGDLYREIQSMEKRIIANTERLKTVTAERERVSTELRTATQIQVSMLPSGFPAFPDRSEFQLYASMNPAKEVGGDFYDFFLVDHQHLAFLIADVSDKGVPAALFMMSAKIIISERTRAGGSPAEILASANATLCRNNKSKMFVTVWLGILDLDTGLLTCSNAGHEYPAVRGQDGVFRVLKDKHGLMVGAMPRAKYSEYEIQMYPGDAIFVYTDGVPEANNAEGGFYGMERLDAALNRLADRDPAGILMGVKEDVDAFAAGAKQFDDVTMLCVEYKGPSASSQIRKEP